MTDETLQKGKGTIDPAKLNPKILALSLASELMKYHPTTSIISDQFCLGRAILSGVHSRYYTVYDDGDPPRPINDGLAGVMQAFDEFEEHSPSIGGRRAEQIVECIINAARTGYQNLNPLYEEKQPGAIERLINFFRGSKQPQQ